MKKFVAFGVAAFAALITMGFILLGGASVKRYSPDPSFHGFDEDFHVGEGV